MKDKTISKWKIIPKVGDEVVGFKFDSYDGCEVSWNPNMIKYVGKEGVVEKVVTMAAGDIFLVRFNDDVWAYPVDHAHLAYKQKGSTVEELLKEIKETKAILESIAEEKKQKEQALISLKEELKRRGVMMVEDVAEAKPGEDMPDPINWKKGDMVVCTNSTIFSDEFIEGQIYTLREDCDGRMVRVVADNFRGENGWGVS